MFVRLLRRLPSIVAWTLLAGVLAPIGAVLATASPAAAAGRGPGEPLPVDLTEISNTPLHGGWGVTGLDPNRMNNYDNQVWDFTQIGDRMYVAGNFLNVQESRFATPISRPYLAAFDIYTGDWIPEFDPQLDGSVYALEVSPLGALLIGGEFTAVEGLPNTEGLAGLDPTTGAIDPVFYGSVQRPWTTERAVVRSLEVIGNDLYIAGNFSHVRGNSDSQRTRVYKAARVDSRWGTPDGTFKPQVTGSGVWGAAIDTDNGYMHLAGWFSAVEGQPDTNNYATVNLSDGSLASGLQAFTFNNNNRQETFDVEVGGDKVWVGGSQHIVEVLDAASRTLLGWHTTSYLGCNGNTFTWCRNFPGGGDYQVVEEIGAYIFAGCHCVVEYNGGGYPNHYSSFDDERFPTLVLEAYDKTTGRLVQSFIPDIAGSEEGAWAVHSDSLGCIWMGGDMEVGGLKTGSSFWIGNFARLCPDGVAGPDTESPTPPTDLTAEHSGDDVLLTWTASTDNIHVAGYDVYRDDVLIDTSPTTAYLDPAPAEGWHTYDLRAFDPTGNRSAKSNVVSIQVGPDVTAPSIPDGVTATVNGNDVTLTWNPSTDDRGVTGYNVYRNAAYIGWTTTETYTDPGLALGTYNYELRAYDAAGNRSDKSVPVDAQVGSADTTPPSIPDGVTAAVNGNDVTLTWNPSTDDRGVTGYNVYRNAAYIGWATTETYTDPGRPVGTFSYELRAYDAAGNRSAKSTPLDVMVGGADTTPPSIPDGVTAAVNGNDVTLTWNPSTDDRGVTGYNVYRNAAYIGWATTETYTDPGRPVGTFSYELRAYDAAGNRSAKSTPLDVMVGGADTTPPSIPDGVTAAVNGNDVTLTWNPSTDDRGVTGYAVYRNAAYIGWATTETYTDPGLALGTYNYELRAYDAANNRSAKSTPLDVMVGGADTTPPSIPDGVTAAVNGNDVTLTWNPSTDDRGVTGYAVYRNAAYIGWATTETYTDPGLALGTYNYELRAYDAANNRSAKSTPLPVTVA